MLTIDQQIEEILKEIRKTPYHKGTERHIGILKAKVAKLKVKKEAAALRGSSGRGVSYGVKKQGDATIVLVGPPSSGKSTLLNRLTNAKSKIAPYAFTTVSVIPGMMEYKNARIQILDVPGLIEGAEEGKGRGREVLSVVRGADLVILLTDPTRMRVIGNIEKALSRNGIRLNEVPPRVKIIKKLNGGIIVNSNIDLEIDKETIKEIVSEMGLKNAEVNIYEKVDVEQLIDVLSKNRVYVKTLKVVNKSDLLMKRKGENLDPSCLYISAEKNEGVETLKEKMWEALEFVKVFLVKADSQPSYDNPMIMKRGDSLKKVSEKIGSEFSENITKAKIWGEGAKFEGQIVSLEIKVVPQMMIRFI